MSRRWSLECFWRMGAHLVHGAVKTSLGVPDHDRWLSVCSRGLTNGVTEYSRAFPAVAIPRSSEIGCGHGGLVLFTAQQLDWTGHLGSGP